MNILEDGAARLGLRLDGEQLERFRIYHRELSAWNKCINLTTVTGWEEAQRRHFLDSLRASRFMPESALSGESKTLDLGSGAGFPGLPLRIAHPSLQLTLLEATGKKAEFLRHVVKVLGIDGVEVAQGRAEDVARQPEMRERFAVVLSRGVARLNALAELCLPFCEAGGVMIAHKGADIADELRQAGNAIDILGGSLLEHDMLDAPFVGDGTLVVVAKRRPTPPAYPRRPGMPTKRPL